MTCARAAELISFALDARPPLAARAGLAVHLVLCAACRRYRRQLAALDRATGDALAADALASAELPPEVAARLRAALDAHNRATGDAP